jgi:hypothetical protein
MAMRTIMRVWFERLSRYGLAAALTILGATGSRAEEMPIKINYEEHIKPILREHCFLCHNQNDAKSDLSLDSFGAAIRGGASGAVVVPGDPDGSRLYQLITHQDTPEMPPERDKLPEAILATVKQWIEQGALETAGSVAKIKAKPKLDMNAASGAARPDGPAAMPEALSLASPVVTNRPAAISALAASPWAPLVAVAGQEQIVFYHANTHELLGVLPFPEGTPYVLKFSRSGALLLAGGGRGGHSGKVVVFDVKTGARVFEVGDELDAVLAADINEDHTRIALGGPGKVVRVFSTADGALLHEIRKHTDWIYAVEFSPDGVLLATADRNGGLFVWEAETAREYQNLKGHTAAIHDVSWRVDSNILASGSEDGTLRLWEMENGQQVKSWNAHGGVQALEFALNGQIVSTGRDRVTRAWDQDGKALREFEALNDVGLEVAASLEGARVVVGDWSGEVRVWNMADGARLANLAANPPSLEILAEQSAQRALVAQQAAQAMAAELAAAEQAVTQATATAQAALAQATASQGTANAAEGERVAVEKSLADAMARLQAAADQVAAAMAALAQVTAEKGTLETALAERAAVAKTSSEQAAAVKAEADKQQAAKTAAEGALTQKGAAIRQAVELAEAIQATAARAAAELEARRKQAAQQSAEAPKEAAAATATNG